MKQREESFIDLSSDSFRVDICEHQDPFEKAYAPWPLRLYLIVRDGKIEWISKPKDSSYDEAVADLMRMLNLLQRVNLREGNDG